MFENSNEWFRGMEVSVGPDGAIYGLTGVIPVNAMIIQGCTERVEEFISFFMRRIRWQICHLWKMDLIMLKQSFVIPMPGISVVFTEPISE